MLVSRNSDIGTISERGIDRSPVPAECRSIPRSLSESRTPSAQLPSCRATVNSFRSTLNGLRHPSSTSAADTTVDVKRMIATDRLFMIMASFLGPFFGLLHHAKCIPAEDLYQLRLGV